jgi:hypothetical protein
VRGSFGDHWSCNARRDRPWQTSALATGQPVLAPFSTRLPPELLDRLLIATTRLELRQGEIAAVAIDRFLIECGF